MVLSTKSKIIDICVDLSSVDALNIWSYNSNIGLDLIIDLRHRVPNIQVYPTFEDI